MAAWAVDREFVDIVCPMGPHGIPLAPHWPFEWLPHEPHGPPMGPHGRPRGPMGSQWVTHGAAWDPMGCTWPPHGRPKSNTGVPWGCLGVLSWIWEKIGYHFPSKWAPSTQPAIKKEPPGTHRTQSHTVAHRGRQRAQPRNRRKKCCSEPPFYTRRGQG